MQMNFQIVRKEPIKMNDTSQYFDFIRVLLIM